MLKYNLIIIFLISGSITSYAVAYIVHQQHITTTKLKFKSAAHDRYSAFKRSIESSIATGNSLLGLFAASTVVEREEFETFSNYILKNNKHIKTIEWVPRVLDKKKTFYEKKAREIFAAFKFTQQDNNHQLVAVTTRKEYYPIYYMQPYKGNITALGYDLASDPAQKKALQYSKENNLPGYTGRTTLFQNNNNQLSFFIYFPIYRKGEYKETVEWRRESINSFIIIVIDIPSLFESSLNYLQEGGIDILVEDETISQTKNLIYFHPSRTRKNSNPITNTQNFALNSEYVFTDIINLNNRVWRITMHPAPGYFITSISFEVMFIFCGGIIITITLFIYLFMSQQRENNLRKDKSILEIKVQQRTKKLNEKNVELETFNYSIAHDLRSPLRSITSFSQILYEETQSKLNNEEKSHINRIISAGKYMAELIDDILELSQINNNNFHRTQLDFSLIVQDIIQDICIEENHQHHVLWEIQPAVKGYADPVLVRMLLNNLLRNAYKFSYKKSKSKIKFGILENETNTYYVNDNGIGFDMKYSENIFGTFKRLHKKEEYEGTGIGLATVKRIAERHDGKAWATAELGAGATFYFTL